MSLNVRFEFTGVTAVNFNDFAEGKVKSVTATMVDGRWEGSTRTLVSSQNRHRVTGGPSVECPHFATLAVSGVELKDTSVVGAEARSIFPIQGARLRVRPLTEKDGDLACPDSRPLAEFSSSSDYSRAVRLEELCAFSPALNLDDMKERERLGAEVVVCSPQPSPCIVSQAKWRLNDALGNSLLGGARKALAGAIVFHYEDVEYLDISSVHIGAEGKEELRPFLGFDGSRGAREITLRFQSLCGEGFFSAKDYRVGGIKWPVHDDFDFTWHYELLSRNDFGLLKKRLRKIWPSSYRPIPKPFDPDIRHLPLRAAGGDNCIPVTLGLGQREGLGG